MSRRVKADVPTQVMRMKVISMGDAAVGKSCLIKRYCEGKFVAKHITTIGIDFGVKPTQVDGLPVHINFWDLAGGQEYFEIRNEFYKDSQGAILVYDVCSRSTFDSLDSWLQESVRYGARNLVLAVCANKVDGGKRAVSEAEGKRWATERGAAFYTETSAKDGTGVQSMFERLFAEIQTSKQRCE